MSSILKLENISFLYPESDNGVRAINLSIREDEIFGLIGPNGSGKTTLAKLILGLLKPNRGKIEFAGQDITKKNVSERAKRIGYVAQDPIEMFFEISVRAEASAGPKFLNLSGPEKRAEEALRLVNIWRYHEKHPDSLSGGEKRLLSIADVLASNPEVLIFDEPEFGLDPKTWRKIAREIKELKARGKTIIVITQDLEIAAFLCDRLALMREGTVLKIDTPKEIFADAQLLKEANLTPLPFFRFLGKMGEEELESEEKFIETLAHRLTRE